MDLIASFHAHKVKSSFFLTVDGISPDGILYFLFDTGAVCSLVGLNSLFPEENAQCQAFAKVVRDELSAAQISPRPESLRTATNQSILTYPCVCHNVSIEGTDGRDFYFPSSIHECILAPCSSGADAASLYRMVCEINAAYTPLEEQLSDNVYIVGRDGNIESYL